MKIENQVCSIVQANKLTSYGLDRHRAHFTWYTGFFKRNGGIYKSTVSNINPFDLRIFRCETLPAFTGTELALFLPEELYGFGCNMALHQYQYCEKGFIVDYRMYYESIGAEKKRIPEKVLSAQTEAQVRAEMLIYLLENNIVSAEYMNRRCQFVK